MVPPVSAVARACASKNPFRAKLTTGSPNPRSANPPPLIVKGPGGFAKSIALGAIALTGPGPVACR